VVQAVQAGEKIEIKQFRAVQAEHAKWEVGAVRQIQ